MNMIALGDGVVLTYSKDGKIIEWHKCSQCETMVSLPCLLESKLDRDAGFCHKSCKEKWEELNWHLESEVAL